MPGFISSVCVVFSSKKTEIGFKSVVLALDPSVGCTASHAVSFVLKNPLVKSYLNDYVISNLNFKYSSL